jgi:hypothetical protein
MTGMVADAELLGRLIFATNLSIEETTEAALALGKTSAAVASGILIQSYPKAGNEELAQCILMGLAERPFHQTQTFFRDMLANPAEQATRKKDVLEALGQMDTVRDQFFVPYLESTDAEIRRGAYLGIGKLTESSLGHRLLLCLQKETDSMARADLYEALSLKDSGNPVLLSQLAVSEQEMDTRLIAAKALAKSLQGTPAGDPSTVAFEKNWIPELTRVVLGASRSQSAQAFAALLMCRESPSTREAFSKIAQESTSATIREMALKSLD